jgi:hypothetical protein
VYRKWDDLQSRKLDEKSAFLSKALMETYLQNNDLSHNHMFYVEAHLFGDLTLNDFESIKYAFMPDPLLGTNPDAEGWFESNDEKKDFIKRKIGGLVPVDIELELVDLPNDLRAAQKKFTPLNTQKQKLKSDQRY